MLRDYQPLAGPGAPLATVIIPARNEAANIETCVSSILGSRYEHLEVIVVDDRSTDDTAAIVRRLAGNDTRVRLVEGAPLPDGWYGKPWACWQGYQAARGELLLFTDADTKHSPDLLPLAAGALRAEGADLVTVMPRQAMESFWERAVQPLFFLLLGLRYGSPMKVNRNRDPRHAIANGQFILVTRASYEAVDGHRSVQGTVIEDLMIARRYLEHHKRHWFAVGDRDMTTRMYDSLPAIVEGWAKNFFRGVMATTQSRALAYVAAALGLLLPLSVMAPPALAAAGFLLGRPALAAFGLTAYAGNTLAISHMLRMSGAPGIFAVFHPLGAAVQAFIFLRAMARGTNRVQWKGRTYSHA